MEDLVIDMSNHDQRRLILETVKGLQGMHTFTIKRYRQLRTPKQNRFFFAAFVAPFADWLEENGIELNGFPSYERLALRILEKECLTRSVLNPRTGELVEIAGEAKDLDTEEFAKFIDRAGMWMNANTGLPIPDARIFREEAA